MIRWLNQWIFCHHPRLLPIVRKPNPKLHSSRVPSHKNSRLSFLCSNLKRLLFRWMSRYVGIRVGNFYSTPNSKLKKTSSSKNSTTTPAASLKWNFWSYSNGTSYYSSKKYTLTRGRLSQEPMLNTSRESKSSRATPSSKISSLSLINSTS